MNAHSVGAPGTIETILHHQVQLDWFRNALSQNRLATSFLFVGPEGIGKRTFAKRLAQALLCRQSPLDQLAACGSCEDCAQVSASTHPDLIEVSKPADKSNIPIDLLIGDDNHRMREGLCHDISLHPFYGRRKIAIIDDADFFNADGANALLKTLEEPPPKSVLILIGTSLQRQLPTIRSRCQAVLFQPLPTAALTQLILQQGLTDDEVAAANLAAISGGSIVQAKLLLDDELREFRSSLLGMLSSPKILLAELAKLCGAIVDAAGKDGRLKRERMKLVFGFAASFYREIALALSPVDSSASASASDELMNSSVQQVIAAWKGGAVAAIGCWDTCLRSMEYVERNANQAGLLEWWGAKIAELSGR